MPEPTFTRVSIRRSIGRMARLEFFMRYGSAESVRCDSDNSTATPQISFDNTDGGDGPHLGQDSDFWVGSWLYDLAQAEERLVTISNSSGILTLEYGFTALSSSGDSFEIWDLWPPSDVHHKISMALRNAWRMFPNNPHDSRVTFARASSVTVQVHGDRACLGVLVGLAAVYWLCSL